MSIRISIITPSYNMGHYIEQTIQSILSQNYEPLEYIVMDGGSTDNTLDILRKYEDRLTWYSERDNGQADAINKGFRRATGDVFAWLNADDIQLPGALQTVAAYFESHPESHFVYGNAHAMDGDGTDRGLRTHVQPCSFESLLSFGDYIVQPAAFWRAGLWQDIGELEPKWRYALDYEYWIRAAQKYELHFIPQTLATERIYSGAKTFSGGIERIDELDEMPRRFGRDGIAEGFRAEGASLYLFRAWEELRHGRFSQCRTDFRAALRMNNDTSKMALYLVALAAGGEAAIPGFRLRMNRLRGAVKKFVIVGSDLEAAEG